MRASLTESWMVAMTFGVLLNGLAAEAHGGNESCRNEESAFEALVGSGRVGHGALLYRLRFLFV